ncbi:MAG: glycosyltransferase family 25 protein [bacterium]|nr:glycosyltransferase family 25 protein [bacterium]
MIPQSGVMSTAACAATSSGKIPIYVVSLPGTDARRAGMAAQLAALGLEFDFVDAIRGSALSAADRAGKLAPAENIRANIGGRDMTDGEIGCALSHQMAYDRILASGQERAFVLEDDARLLPGFLQALQATHEIADLDVLIFGYPKLADEEVRLAWLYDPVMVVGRLSSGHVYGLRPRQGHMGMVGYLVSRGGCEKLKRNFPLQTVADDHPFFVNHGARVWHLRPFAVMEDTGHVSTIRGDFRQNRHGLSVRKHLSRLLRGLWRHVQVMIMAMTARSST